MFCQKCGKPSESVICPECAAAEATENTAAESVQPVEDPVETPVEAPVEAPAEAIPAEEPAIELGDAAPVEAPKKSKKGLWIGLVAVVAAIAVAAVAFWPTIKGWFSSPEEQFRDTARASLTSYTEALSNAYGTLLKGDTSLNLANYNNIKEQLSLELNASLAASLSAALQEYGINLNAADLTKIGLNLEIAEDNDLLYLGLDAGLAAKDLLAIKAYADIQNSIAYLGVPALSDQYLKLDLKAMLGIDLANLDLMDLFAYNAASLDASTASLEQAAPNAMMSYLELMTSAAFGDLQAALPSQEEFNAMLNRYIDVVLDQITTVEETTETVTANGHTQSQTVLAAKVDQALLINIGKAVLQEAKNDTTIKNILTEVEKFITATTGEAVALYDEFTQGIDGAIAEADAATDVDAGNYLLIKTYLDGDESMGAGLSVFTAGSEVMNINYNTVNDDDTYYFQLATNGMAGITGSYTVDGDTTKGTLDTPLSVSFECSPTKTALRITPPAELLNTLTNVIGAPPSVLQNLALEIVINQPSDAEVSLRYALLSGDAALVALNVGGTGSNTTVALPQNVVDINDRAQFNQWIQDAFTKLPDLLGNLGMTQDTINELLSDLVRSMMGI